MTAEARLRRGAWPAAVSLLFALAPRPASADTTTQKNLADALFAEAQGLMDAGKHAEACPKFVESQRLDPSGGTLLHLAMCREGEGKTASAYALFKDTLTQARRDGRKDREAYAEARLRALESRLSRLTIEVAPAVAAMPGVDVSLDGQSIPRLAWGTRLAVDPGDHVVRVTAPGAKPREERVSVGANAEARVIAIASLEPLEPSGPASAEPPPSSTPDRPAPPGAGADEAPSDGRGRRAAGLAVGGAGLVLAGLGGYFGVRALHLKAESDDLCPAPDACRPGGAAAMDDANTAASFANVFIPAGALAVVVGGYLFLSAPRAPARAASGAATRLSLATSVGPGGGTLRVDATF